MGSGSFAVAAGGHEARGPGATVRYVVEVEQGIDISPGEFAAEVEAILLDPRGWTADGRFAFERRDEPPVDVRVTLATPGTVDEECAPLETSGRYSCWNGERAMINLDRWLHGSATYAGDLTGYRRYLVNHEVGHGLGFGHADCPEEAAPAPVMMQQTISIGTCSPNPWPHPERHRPVHPGHRPS